MHKQTAKLTIYSDALMSNVIDTRLIQGNSLANFQKNDQEYDLLDGEDWWEDYASEIENQYGASWYCFEVVSSDKKYGRILERNYCINYEKPVNFFNWMNKIYLFGDKSWDLFEKNFSDSISYTLDLSKINSDQYYRFGTDEHIISMLRVLGGNQLRKCTVLDVVINPAPKTLLSLKLTEPYKFPIYLPSKTKVERLRKLNRTLQISSGLFDSLITTKRTIADQSLEELQFLSDSIDKLAELLDQDSPNSISSIFIDEFVY
jgi:hypothetical protein